jgi:hypothetical protein
VTIKLGRSQNGVFGDAFETDKVDMNDLYSFPDKPGSAGPHEVTRGEIIMHFVAERQYAQVNGIPKNTKFGFAPAHAAGIAAENDYRDDLNMIPVLSIKRNPTNSPAGNPLINFDFIDSSREQVELTKGDVVNRDYQ